MVTEATRPAIGIKRHFTKEGQDPYDTVKWVRADASLKNHRTGEVNFEQLGVEVPATWSQNATNILAQKYFRGTQGTAEREFSLKQVADRVVDTITQWGIEGDYFDEAEAEIFRAELKYLVIHQMAAFNSPVWFNIGVAGVPQQASACFILSVEDTMASILNWYTEEGTIFQGGSGAGVNLSRIRSSKENLRGGGTASGPVSFMRGADASAGTIKSGGKTRRAAKMVILDVDHPDIEDFIWCKALEERKARVLREAGFDMDLDGKDTISIQYQNANNSVRVTDEFMQAVVADGPWELKAVKTGETLRVVQARELFRQIAQSAWECADPGMQFDSTINRWHTASNTGRINGSNPCSEYMHLDNSACNLASLNLIKYLRDDDTYDLEAYHQAIEIVIIAQEILVGRADYPTVKIGENAKAFRQLGMGYANIGALLMAQGLAYDSDAGRAWAAVLTSIMTGHAYATSAKMAARVGTFDGYAENEEPMLRVLRQHRDEVSKIEGAHIPEDLLFAAEADWHDAVELGTEFGVRNSQASVMAPTGTIGLLMDCDTTGIEPDLGLVKTKKLVGSGDGANTMTIVNQTVPRALKRLGYTPKEVDDIVAYIFEHKSIMGAPAIKAEHLPIFACSMGDNTIQYMGHIRMMGAVQPFISGAISKTVNLPEDVTVEDVEQAHLEAWQLGIKAVAIYRDNCKVAQPLSVAKKAVGEGFEHLEAELTDPVAQAEVEELRVRVAELVAESQKPVRRRLSSRRKAEVYAFNVQGFDGYITVGLYEDGSPGEVFIKVSKQGSTLAGLYDVLSIVTSMALQHGVPLEDLVAKFINMDFEPHGIVGKDEDIRMCKSIPDFIFRRLAISYLPESVRRELNIHTVTERKDAVNGTASLVQAPAAEEAVGVAIVTSDAPFCPACGVQMQRSGACHTCPQCADTDGCS